MYTVIHMCGGCVQDVSFYATGNEAHAAIEEGRKSYGYSISDDPEWLYIDSITEDWAVISNEEES